MRGGYVTPFTSSEAFSMANFNSRIEEINDGIDSVGDVANNALNVANNAGFNPTYLWTNSSPTTEFEQQDVAITIPTTAKFIVVEFAMSTYNPENSIVLIFNTQTGMKPTPTMYGDTSPYVDRMCGRKFEYTGTKFTFFSGYAIRISTGSIADSLNNAVVIPLKIGYLK